MVLLIYDLRDPGGAIVLVRGARERYWSRRRWCAGGRVYWEQFRTTNAVYKCHVYNKLGLSLSDIRTSSKLQSYLNCFIFCSG